MTEINSSKNSNFRLWKSLLESRGIKKEGLMLVSGRKIVPELLKDKNIEVKAALTTKKADARTLAANFDQVFLLHRPLFAELDILGTDSTILVLKAPKLTEWKSSEPPRSFELLLGLSDPGNLGAILRSCVAFGVRDVVLLKECANPFLPRVLKASSGAALSLNLMRGPSIQDLELREGICLDLEGEDIRKFEWPKQSRLLLGEEGQGIPDHLRSMTRIKIPMSGEIESLNAVVAASIALFARQN